MGWPERFWRGARNPTIVALVITALAAIAMGSGGGVWLLQQRAELRNEVVTTVAQAVSLRQGFHFHEARQLLEQVRRRVERGGSDALRRQVDQARADVILVQRLDDARTRAATLVDTDGIFDPAESEPLYRSAFADAGLGRDGDDSEAVVAAVRASRVRGEIVAALDDWASVTRDLRRREWLLAVARGADPDEVRDRLRQPELWRDAAGLTRVARELRVAELSPQLATALGRVSQSGGEAIALLTATQNRFPQDFWVTFELAWALNQERRWDEGLGYFRAALACGPNPAQPTTAWARSCAPWAEWTRRSTPWSKLFGSTPGICWHTTTSPSLTTPRAGWMGRSSTGKRPSALHQNPPRCTIISAWPCATAAGWTRPSNI